MKKRNYRSYRQRQKRARIARDIVALAALVTAVALLVLLLKSCGGDGEEPQTPDTPSATTTSSTTLSASSATTTASTTAATATTTTAKAPSSTAKTTQTTQKTTATTAAPVSHYIQKDRSQWNLLLVNAWNPIDAAFEQSIEMKEYRSTDKYFDARAIEALERMMRDAGSNNLYAVSFYRSRATQDRLFKNKVQRLKNGGYKGADVEDKAATVVARPGTSEHQTGLAADILGSGYDSLTEGFEDTKAFKWLKEHCAEYGFILRYPKNKQHITGVIYEPWHYRYVGVEHAEKIMEQGLCLEEYLEQIGG